MSTQVWQRWYNRSKQKIESRKSSVRSKVEHIFRIIKCQFGYRKVRYRGLKKNENRLYVMFACANLYFLAMAGRKLQAAWQGLLRPFCGITSKNRAKASVRAKKLAEFRPVSSPFAFMPFDMGFFQRFLNHVHWGSLGTPVDCQPTACPCVWNTLVHNLPVKNLCRGGWPSWSWITHLNYPWYWTQSTSKESSPLRQAT